ncbi:MAG: LysR family transcriptional regulator [Pseudomonadota bacterium]
MKSLTDLRKLRHVVGVARAGSFTTASNNLAITQSALTKSVAEVEYLLGVKLFTRLPRGVTLTEAGALFVPRAERILADTQSLMTRLDDLQSLAGGNLRIAVAPSGFIGFLEASVSAFAKVYPGVQIEVIHGEVENMASNLIQGDVDLLLGLEPNLVQWTEFEVNPVAALNVFFISRLQHPVAGVANIDAQTLMRYPLVLPKGGFITQAQIAKAYIDAGLTPRPAHYVVDHFPIVERLVAATDAIAPVVTLSTPQDTFRDRFKVYRDVVDLDIQSLAIARSKVREHMPAASAFVDLYRGFSADGRIDT